MVTLLDGATLIEAAGLPRSGTDLVVVCNITGTLSGVVSKTNIVNEICQCQGATCMTTLASAMTRDVLYCLVSEPLEQVWERMKERGLKNIPAVDEQLHPVGLLRARDVLQVLLEETSEGTALLRDYVMGIGYQ